jgi:two-component system cell cycle sensor histidine kinase/response regulator CckA
MASKIQNWLKRLFPGNSYPDRLARLAMEQASDAIFLVDPDGRIMDANLKASELTGYARDELLHLNVHDLVTQRSQAEQPLQFDRLVAGESLVYERELQRKDGGLVEIEVSAKALTRECIQAIVRDISGRQKSWEALRESEERFRLAFEDAPIGMALVGLDERFLQVNQALCDMLGYTKEELLTKTVPAITHPDDLNIEATYKGQTIQGQVQHFQMTKRYLHADGHIVWGNLIVSMVRDPKGQPAYYIGQLEDITERVRSEEALNRSLEETAHSQMLLLALSKAAGTAQRARQPEEVFRVVGDEMKKLGYQTAILQLTEDQQSLRVAHLSAPPGVIARSEKLTGVSMETLRFPLDSSEAFRQLVQGDNPVFEDVQTEYLASLLPESLRSKARRLATMFRIRQSIGAPLKVGGKLYGLLFVFGVGLRKSDMAAVSTFANATAIAIENAQLSLEIRQQAQRLQDILDTIPEGILLLDVDHRIQLANPAGMLFLGALADVKIGETLLKIADKPLSDYLDPAPSGWAWHELRLDPPRRIFELAAHPLETGQRHTGWVLILRDITQPRERQEYQQVQERLAVVGQLAAGVAHDFNNIMAVITLYAELVLKSPELTSDDRARLTTIYQQALRAARLVGQILDFSRRSVIDLVPMELVAFLKDLVRLLEHTLPENIKISLSVAEKSYVIKADPTRLQQAIVNLGVNARDAMPEGGELRIDVSGLTVTPGETPPLPGMAPGAWVKLLVSDTGSGIEPGNLSRVFEPFFTTKPPGQGTGLGLAQVYGIIKQHNGHIDITSQVGRGTSFSIYLPILVTAASTEELPGAPLGEPVASGKETILVVEDQQATREAICDTLEALGYRVLSARNGKEALKLFRPGEIALVLSDLIMPVMGGEALYKALTQIDPNIKMVLITGYPEQESSKTLLEAGLVTWIAKPFSANQLARVVTNLLET